MKQVRIEWLVVLAIVLAAFAAVAAPGPGSEVDVLPLYGDVDTAAARAFVKQLETALDRSPRYVIVEIDARGAEIDPVHFIVAALSRPHRAETIAYITGSAAGATPLVALACDHIAMAPSAAFGPCGPGGPPDLANELARAAAERRYPETIAAALGGRADDLFRVTHDDPSGAPRDTYVSEAHFGEFTAKHHPISVQRIYASELSRVDAAQAQRFGFAKWISRSRGALVTELEAVCGPLDVREAEGANGFERFLAAVARHGLLPVFMFLGLLGIAIEIWHPSLIFPGAMGIICVAVALSGGHLAGLSSALGLCFMVGGIVLVLLEMFVIPGFGAPGVIGLISLLLGAFLALQESPWPRTDAQMAQWREGAKTFALGLASTVGAFGLVVRLLPASPLLRRLVHTSVQNVEDGYTVAPAARVAFLGRLGRASTDLRPSGKVEIEGEVVDATSDGTWIPRGEAVEVIETSENRLVVRKKPAA